MGWRSAGGDGDADRRDGERDDPRGQGRDQREGLGRLLRACGLDEAVAPFEAWRLARRMTNGLSATVVGGLLAPSPALSAGDARARFLRELNEGSGRVRHLRP